MIKELMEFLSIKFFFISKYFSEEFKEKIGKDLTEARMGEPEEFVSSCFGLSLILSSFSLIFFQPLIFLILFASCFFISCKYPFFKKKKIARKIESELPNTLRMMGIELNINLSFESCLHNIAETSEEFQKIVSEVEKGASIPEALQNFSLKTDSRFVKRAVVQLINTYEKGGNGEALKKIAEEQEAVLRSKIKEYNGKMVMYSLVFIACSAVLPALFGAFIIIGSSFLNIAITPLQAFLIPAFFFPMLNICLLFLIRLKKP